MSENKNTQNQTKGTSRKKMFCGLRTPAPYPLKTVVGYNDHCLSKFRNPAFTFGQKYVATSRCQGPGPYVLPEPKSQGFTIGRAVITNVIQCTPGPYAIKEAPRNPAFSIIGRRPEKYKCSSPGPYDIKFKTPGPAFTLGMKPYGSRCDAGPGPRGAIDINLIKPASPMFTFGIKQIDGTVCKSPGPYGPFPPAKSPMFSFGMKHSDCSPPLVTECDKSW